MENYITFENMPPSAQKAYKKSCRNRKISLFVSCFGIVFLIIYMIAAIASGDMGAFPMFFILACVHGWVHMSLHFKSMPLIIWFFATYVSGALSSWFFVITDIIKFVRKEPLVAPSEHKYFLKTRAAQAEMMSIMAERMEDSLESDRQNLTEDTMENIKKLKELFDSGAITEEEFNRKKSELLELI